MIASDVLFFFYAYRSMLARFRANLLTMIAVCLLVAGASLGFAFYEGLRAMLVDTTPAENIIVMSKGASSEEDSKLALDAAHKVALLDGIAKNGSTPLATRELVTRLYLDETSVESTVVIRGVDEQSLRVHHATVSSGVAPAPGSLEVLVGRRIADKYPSKVKIGDSIALPGGPSKVTGIMTADGGPFEDEIWTPRSALELHINVKYSSSVTLVALDKEHVQELVDKINQSKDLDVKAIPVAKMLEDNANLQLIARVVLILVVLLSLVATFAIATTMNANTAVRMPEFAALAAIGIHRSILGRIVLFESLLLAVVGAIVGVILCAVVRSQVGALSFGAHPVEMASSASVFLIGLGLGVLVALIAGTIPAVKVARLDIMLAMR